MNRKIVDLLLPRAYFNSVSDIDLDDLQKRGINCLLIDLDNTIIPWHDWEVPASSAEWVAMARARGFKFCIASNTRNPKRLRAVAAELGVPCLDKIAKPRRRGLRAAVEILEGRREQAAMIGDQIFTDILGGNRLGIYTILVNPMNPHEFIGTRFTRLVERPLIAWFTKHGLLGTKGRSRASEVQD